MSIEELDHNVRSAHVLEKCGILYIDELRHPRTWEKIFNQRSCGRKTLEDIILAFAEHLRKESEQTAEEKEERAYKARIKYTNQLMKQNAENCNHLIKMIMCNIGAAMDGGEYQKYQKFFKDNG